MHKDTLYKTNLTYSNTNMKKKSYSVEKFIIPESGNNIYYQVVYDKNNIPLNSNVTSYENFVPIDFGRVVSKKELQQRTNNAAVQQQIVAQHKKQDMMAAEKQATTDKLKKLQLLIAEHKARSGDLVKSADELQQEVKDLQKTLDNDY